MKINIVLICLMFLCSGRVIASWNMDLETGIVSVGYNDIRIPGNSGTRFSLTDSFSVDNKAFYRLRLTSEIKKDRFVSFLYAPLSLSAEGVTQAQIDYNNDVFPANTALSAKYRFDSYRMSYWKNFRKSEKLLLKLGFTAKIRDAAIRISSAAKESEKKNTGFVPLLNFGLAYNFTQKLAFLIDGDALAGGPGRAEDVLLAVSYKNGGRYSYRIGYRFVEGGADTKEVYNFAMLNYISAGVSIDF